MRKARFVAAIAAVVALLYVIAGYWLAPRFVRDALTEQAARRGMEVRIERIRTDPFALAARLEGIEATGPDGGKLASARSARADLGWSSLWERRWRIQALSLDQPQFLVSVGNRGAHHWPLANRTAEGEGTPLFVERLSVTDGAVHVVDRSHAAPVELKLEALTLEATGLSTSAGEAAQYALDARLGTGGSISLRGRISLAPLGAEGRLQATAVGLAPLAQFAAHSLEPPRGQVDASSDFSYANGKLVLENVAVEAANAAYEGIELEQASLESPRIGMPPDGPFRIVARARAADGAQVSARGTVQAEPPAADLELDAADVALVRAQRWLPKQPGAKLASGALSAKGRLRLANGGVKYEGGLAVHALRLEEHDSGNLLLAWQRMETAAARVQFAPLAVELGEVVAQAPQGRLIIEPGGSVNFARAFKGSGKEDGEPLQVSVRRLRIEKGTLEFADRSLDTPFEATIRELSGTVTGFSTEPGDPALVALSGRVEKYGSARIGGTINLDDPGSLADIRARLRNLDLAQLTPYVVKFAGYRVHSGRLSADLRYRVRDGRLVGQNQLVFQQLELGEKVQREGLKSLPLELVVALLADPQGRINLDIPVSGDLNDPQFNFGGLFARALGNVVGNIASAPFRALAALFGGGGEALGEIRFQPGSAELAPPEEESVARVAAALAERPGLGVTVRGGYDPERDAAALRTRAVRQEIARRAGYRTAGPLDFGDMKILHAAENLYLKRIGNRLELQALRSGMQDSQHYGRALIEQLAAQVALDAAAPEALARTRAETVRASLVEQGVDPSRVALEAPAASTAAKEGVATQLALTSGPGDAAAGASR
jgi:hypothetical protein